VQFRINAFEVNGGQQRNSKQNSNNEQRTEKLPDASETNNSAGGPVEHQIYQEEQIRKAIEWFAVYLRSERETYYETGKPLTPQQRRLMCFYFDGALLEEVRFVQLVNRRVENPWFYPHAREHGVRHLPDVTHKAAVTFLDVVVFNEKITNRDLFHGLVHAAQVKTLGVAEFTDLFVRGFLRARSYFLVPLKAHAFALDARYASNADDHFPVEDEIRSWWQQGRYS